MVLAPKECTSFVTTLRTGMFFLQVYVSFFTFFYCTFLGWNRLQPLNGSLLRLLVLTLTKIIIILPQGVI